MDPRRPQATPLTGQQLYSYQQDEEPQNRPLDIPMGLTSVHTPSDQLQVQPSVSHEVLHYCKIASNMMLKVLSGECA